MYIPSYDDLTPSIPDVEPSEVFDVARILPPAAAVATIDGARPRVVAGGLFACLHSAKAPAVCFAIAKDFSPRIQRVGASAVLLDVGGLGQLLGDAQAIGAELWREARARAKDIQVAVAPTQTAAHLFALHATARVVTEDLDAALAPIPLTVLRTMVQGRWGEAAARDDDTFDVLRRWGLTTIGEFAALPAGDLSQRIGQNGLALQRLAAGIDPAPLVPDPGVPRFVQSIELEWPIDQLEALAFVLPRLLDPLAEALERADRGAAAIRTDLRLADRTMHARLLQLPAAMRDPRVLRTLVLLDLESHPPRAGIDVITIEADPAPARILQYSLLERARPSAETLATLTARLNALVGDTRCGTPVLRDTHRPDAFEMQRFAPPSGARGSGLGARGSGSVLRRLRPPVAIRVTVDRGRPVHIAIDRRGMPGGRVERAAGPWRTSGSWWDTAEARWDRDEWDVEVADAVLCRIFHDRLMDKWFLEGCID